MLTRLAQSWDRFFHQPVDVRVCAAFRIGFGILALINVVGYAPFVEEWFTEAGAVPLGVSRILIDPDTITVFNWLPATGAVVWTCYGLFVLNAAALLIGFRSRFQAVAVFFWLVSFQHRNYLINDGEDTLFRLFAFLLIFLPLSEVWSVDAWIARRRGRSPHMRRPAWALRLIQIQTAVVMLCAGFEKWLGADWRDGTAMYYVSRVNDLFGRFPLPDSWFDSLPLLHAMSWSTLAFETAAPVLVWIPQIRLVVVAAAIGFHLWIDYTMNLFLFQWLMILGWLSFVRVEDVRRLLRRKP